MASDYRISMLVIDQPGVLARISNLFGAHEVNIESIQTKNTKRRLESESRAMRKSIRFRI